MMQPAPAYEAGIALLPRAEPLPQPWFGITASVPSLICDLCDDLVYELWPLIRQPANLDVPVDDADWLICRRCAEAVRP